MLPESSYQEPTTNHRSLKTVDSIGSRQDFFLVSVSFVEIVTQLMAAAGSTDGSATSFISFGNMRVACHRNEETLWALQRAQKSQAEMYLYNVYIHIQLFHIFIIITIIISTIILFRSIYAFKY